ncbi:MAG: hypothetical protein MZU97_05160 [Bacillus subtilis]|nr:hypothetical protein [Bacillus subtilis]
MAKTAWRACARHATPACSTSSVLTHPTTGGVAASFATLGDINIAEQRRVDRLRRSARHQADDPPGTAGRIPNRRPFQLQHGMVDLVARTQRTAQYHRASPPISSGRRATPWTDKTHPSVGTGPARPQSETSDVAVA